MCGLTHLDHAAHLTVMGAMAGTIERDLGSVVGLAAGGDEVAFGRIVAAYHAEMLRICIAVARDSTLAEEAVQSAWAIAWRKLGSVREPSGSGNGSSRSR